MRKIALGQVDQSIREAIGRNAETFSALAFAVTGNPRLLLKTLSLCPRLSTRDVNDVIKSFYRSTIWTDHSALSESFPGHRSLVDWGRDFIEKTVLPEMKARNERRTDDSTAYFWIHRDSPERVKQGIRLLAYTGIVQKGEEGMRGTRSEIGTRYMVNLGCLLALEVTPVSSASHLTGSLSIKRFLEFGSNHPAYQSLRQIGIDLELADTVEDLKQRLSQSANLLDISEWQKQQLAGAGIATIGDVMKASEQYLIEKLHYVGPVRARRIRNAADAAVLEYLSG